MKRLLCLLFGCKGALRPGATCSRRYRSILPDPWPGPPPIPNYRAIGEGVAAKQAEYRYGDDRTIHGSSHVDVELDADGQVCSVWFSCHPIAFKQAVVDESRAKDMRRMYEDSERGFRPIAIVFKEAPLS